MARGALRLSVRNLAALAHVGRTPSLGLSPVDEILVLGCVQVLGQIEFTLRNVPEHTNEIFNSFDRFCHLHILQISIYIMS